MAMAIPFVVQAAATWFGASAATAAFAGVAASVAYGVFGPKPKGPGPGDLSSPGVQLGHQLPRPYGQVRLTVTPIWIPDEFRSTAHSSSGKGTSSGPSSYTYETDVLGVVCDTARVIAVTREWWNKKIINTALADSSLASLARSIGLGYYASVLDQFGGPSQMPAPLYETAVGAANAPAYRHMFSREYASVQCGGSKTLPLMEVEVITKGTQGATAALTLLQSRFIEASADDESAYARGAPTISATGATLTDGELVITDPDAGSHYVSYAPSGLTSNGTDALTFEAIIRNDNSPASSVGVRFVHGIYSHHLYWPSNGPPAYLAYDIIGGLGDEAQTSGAAGIGENVHVAIVFTSTALRVYVAGALLYTLPGDNRLPITDAISVVFGSAVGSTHGPACTGFRVRQEEVYTGSSFAPPTEIPPPDAAYTTWTPEPETLDDVITAELLINPAIQASDFDVTDLASVEVTGYIAIGPPMSTVADLCDIYYVHVVPGTPIRFVRAGAAVAGAIPFADSGVGIGQAGLRFEGIKQGGNDEISGVKALSYPDINRDHNNGFQRGDRLTTEGPDVQRIDTRVVMTAEEAKGRALTATLLARDRKNTSAFAISDKYAAAEPGDSYTTTDKEGNSYRQRILRFSYADGVKQCDWELDQPSSLIASGAADMSDEPGIEIAPTGDAEWEALDLYQLRDADEGAGYYLASKTHDDSLAYAFESSNDATYAEVETFELDAVFGSVTALTGTLVAGNFFDEGAAITVDVGDGTLASATRPALLADRTLNAFAVGVNGRWVCGQYRTATPVSAGVYTLSGLLLDRFEDARYVDQVVVGDVFCRLSASGGFARIPRTMPQLGTTHFVKVVSQRSAPASIDGEAFTADGVSLKPLSPVHLRAERDAASGDIAISATPRTFRETRFGGPLGDAWTLGFTEAWRWRLYTDATFTTELRDLGSTATASVAYTAAQRATDGHALGAPLYVDARLVSDVGGAGYPLQDAA